MFRTFWNSTLLKPFQYSVGIGKQHHLTMGQFIVFVWSQYDGVNIDKEQLAEVPSKTYRSRAENYERRLILDPTNKILIQPFTI